MRRVWMPVVGNLDPSNPRVSSSPPAPRFLKSWTIKRAFMATSGLFVVRLRSTNCIEIQPSSSTHDPLCFKLHDYSLNSKIIIALCDTSHNQNKVAWISPYFLLWNSFSKYRHELMIWGSIRIPIPEIFCKTRSFQGGHIYHNFLKINTWQIRLISAYIDMTRRTRRIKRERR